MKRGIPCAFTSLRHRADDPASLETGSGTAELIPRAEYEAERAEQRQQALRDAQQQLNATPFLTSVQPLQPKAPAKAGEPRGE